MSRVFKCDRCGEIFKENDGAERMVEDAEEEWDEVEERMRKPYINPNAVSNHIKSSFIVAPIILLVYVSLSDGRR